MAEVLERIRLSTCCRASQFGRTRREHQGVRLDYFPRVRTSGSALITTSTSGPGLHFNVRDIDYVREGLLLRQHDRLGYLCPGIYEYVMICFLKTKGLLRRDRLDYT